MWVEKNDQIIQPVPDSVLKERLVKEGVQFLLFRRPRGTKRLAIQTNNLETKKVFSYFFQKDG